MSACAATLAAALLLAAGCAGVGEPVAGAPAHHRTRGFVNSNPDFERPSFWTVQRFRAARLIEAIVPRRAVPVFPRADNDGRALRDNAGTSTVTWIGHATLLFQLDGLNVLTDPQWSERASPLSFAGPRRIAAPGVRFEDLPRIDVVVLSHDHYDHLDRATVSRLAAVHRPLFLVPLGLKAWFADIGVTNVEELDWWQQRVVGALTFTCVPVQHWSARTPFDMNRRLWSGWTLAGRQRRAFFSGDTGYYAPEFRAIGERLGPFDLAAIAIGGYEPPEMMRMTHTTPEESLDIFTDVRARTFVAMHWGTFDIAEEPLDEPPRRLREVARARGIPDDRVWVLQHGETRDW
ncbi:MAG: MBL fold metallo-hydrolase [Candidatus Rokuibacteriota bacterium]